MSWRILLEDIATAYGQARRGEAVRLAAPGMSFGRWAERLAEYGKGAEVRRQLEYWTGEQWGEAGQVPVEMREGENTEGSAQNITVELSRERTRELLQQVPQAYHTEINEVLLTALGQALGEWSGERRLVVNVEGHGREELAGDADVSRTVGWFTTLYPVMVEWRAEQGAGARLEATKERLGAMPGKGLGYGLLRYGGDAEAALALAAQPQGEVSFNYLGQFEERYGESRWGARRRAREPCTARGGSARTCWTCWRW